MFEDISGMTREEILERIKDNGFFIANVKDPDEEMQLEAIEENYFCIRFYKPHCRHNKETNLGIFYIH